jgi:hypothetical protein
LDRKNIVVSQFDLDDLEDGTSLSVNFSKTAKKPQADDLKKQIADSNA